MDVKEHLKGVSAELRSGREVPAISPRELISWFGGLRRGSWIVFLVRKHLDEAGLTTEPDFESAYIDAQLQFRLAAQGQSDNVIFRSVASAAASVRVEVVVTERPVFDDPTYRLSKLEAANRRPLAVSPNSSVREAVTLMMTNDYSQLPVMVNERDVKGVVSWHSIGARLGLGATAVEVREVMDSHNEVPADASLFQAIPVIVAHQYVLIRAQDNSIVGIVTASDLSLQFQQLSEPFLLLGEVENHIRRILGNRLSPDDLAAAKDPEDEARFVKQVSDLTFGEYLRLIENPDHWIKLKLPIDRASFADQLDRIRLIRNDVMHFDPDGIPEEDLERLRKMVSFLQRLQEIGVS